MFTGIVTDLGKIREISRNGDMRLVIGTHYPAADLAIGASIAHNGVCLTVIAKGSDWYEVQASDETLSKTTMGAWRVGQRINLERALRLGDELGGHLVSGHVDGVARLAERRPEKDSLRLGFVAPPELARFVAPKGSVALDGVSLTVNEVEGARFGVNIIPHTQDVTTLGRLSVGDPVNMEIDMLARYVARLIAKE
jgi:riboflavin synthase